MNDQEIDILISKLNWKNKEKFIRASINELVNIDANKLNKLILPQNDKALWENSAKVLFKIGFPKVNAIFEDLFIWLQDLNWPGCNIIVNLFKNANRNDLINNIEKVAKIAISNSDEMWIGGLKVLIKEIDIKENEFDDKELFKIIENNLMSFNP